MTETSEDTVSEVMSRSVYSLSPMDPTRAALDLMIKQDIGAVLVLEGSGIRGIVTERDIVKRIAGSGASDLAKPLQQIASSPVITAKTDTKIWEAFTIMLRNKIRRLPVLDGSTLVGIVTERDLFKWVVKVAYEPNIPEDIRKLIGRT
jgi:CBS domain-containing protein